MSIIDDFDLHQFHWPGSSPQTVAARASEHRGAGHDLATKLTNVGGEVSKATLSCACGDVLVIIDYPPVVEVAALQKYSSAHS